MLVKVKPRVGEIGLVHFPAFLDRYHNPMAMVYIGKIQKVHPNGDILIDNAPKSVPVWRLEWFTFGGIPMKNKKFNTIKIGNENTRRLSILRKGLKKK